MLWPQQQSLPKNKFPENKLIVEIESCENCESHAHIAGHYQKKYQYFYKQIQRKLYSIGILVQKKHRTLDLFQLLEMSTVEQKNIKTYGRPNLLVYIQYRVYIYTVQGFQTTFIPRVIFPAFLSLRKQGPNKYINVAKRRKIFTIQNKKTVMW